MTVRKDYSEEFKRDVESSGESVGAMDREMSRSILQLQAASSDLPS